jgi:hypothetical protein
MKLSVIERVLLGGMLSTYQGSFTNLKLVREGREALSFNEEENRLLGFNFTDDNISWNPTAALQFQDVEIKLGDNITSIIKDMLMKLNEEEKLTEQHFSLYEKFIT